MMAALEQALQAHELELATYCRLVRAQAQRQFIVRATINRIQKPQ